MKIKFKLLIVVLLLTQTVQAQWLNQNPGAGGQVQSLDPDPNTDGTVYFSSDVEGCYRSDNNGLSWTYIGYELRFNMTFGITVEPGNANRIYSAGCGGLHISDNKGDNWPTLTLAGYPLSRAYVNPSNVNQVFAGIGFRYKNQVPVSFQNAQSNSLITGRRLLFRSNDKGLTWDSLEYEPATGYRNTYSLDFDPNDNNTLYLGAAAGLYKSTNSGTDWTKIAQPTGTFNCYGACISPDGQFIYASFATVNDPTNSGSQTTTTTKLYVSPTANITSGSWTVLDTNGWNLGQTNATTGATTTAFNGAWWTPKMDPRSTPTQHKIIIGTASNARQGLYEGTFNYSSGTLNSYNWLRVFYARGSVNPGPTAAFTYEPGWEDFIPGVQAFNYTPSTWAERGIWATGLQNYYYANTATPGFPYNNAWQNRYTKTIANAGTNSETYETLGTACTVNYDGTGYNNYSIQGQADNGILESWDGGISWATRSKPTTTQTEAVEIANIGTGKTPVVVAHGQPNAFGGGGTGGSLFAKRLVNSSNTDVWAHIAGGTSSRAGLPNATIRDIAVDPNNTERVYLGLFRTAGNIGGGVMLINDIEAFYTGNAVVGGGHGTTAATTVPIVNITAAPLATGSAQAAIEVATITSLNVDPNNSNVIYATASGFLYKGEFNGTNWNWTTVLSGGGLSEVSVWDYNGVTYMAIKGNFNNTTIPGSPAGETSVAISNNGGSSWTSIMSESLAENLRVVNWHNASTTRLNAGDMVGYHDKLFIGWHTFGYNKGFGVFMGTIPDNASTAVTWSDFSDDIHFPRIRRMRITKNSTDENIWLYTSTQGNGGWKRDITALITLPVSLTSFSAKLSLNNEAVLNWKTSSEANNSHFIIQRSYDGKTFEDIARVSGAGNSNTINNYTYADVNLNKANSSDNVIYYRLKQVDFDEKSSYSKIISIKLNTTTIVVSPNPAKDSIFINLAEAVKVHEVKITNMAGQTVLKTKIRNSDYINVSSLAAGTYVLTISKDGIQIHQQKIIINP
ncbi:T9SS type A sorting domain-containing protein [Pedobacter puniceum]|uniref:T9SS type A sorting domain-containing protein n=1 Tax=Pedobacter puniceum TaxID=2666136 RepID=A0A7K0FLR0_9SPHI|nr:T9SS type A sorting domain-containing protein [Pedobacter puniceum]MRX46898.1 T9SS type A sorting domain-containing protein [Pedobacter puniceum]